MAAYSEGKHNMQHPFLRANCACQESWTGWPSPFELAVIFACICREVIPGEGVLYPPWILIVSGTLAT